MTARPGAGAPAYVARSLARCRPQSRCPSRREGRDVQLRLTPDEAKEFSLRLMKAMGRRGLTAAQLARLVPCEDASIYHYMSGYSAPMAGRLEAMARALGCSAEWLAVCSDEPGFDGDGADTRAA
ncbi:MAG TPA: helix-turn-helix domain-containing protein [Polyangiaceae bacterium]|nr:helix-turn-helix domain-containing protein [Polyangiaceae bacterium]